MPAFARFLHCNDRGCFGRPNPAPIVVPRQVNTTLVPDWAEPPGADIPPYSRPTNPGLTPTCASGSDCGGTGETPCASWPLPRIENTFEADGTVDLAPYCRIGFKNVQAAKQWHGRFEMGLADGCTVTMSVECGECEYEPEHPTPTTTKYLGVDLSMEYTEDTVSFVRTQTTTVDKTTGVIALGGWSETVDNAELTSISYEDCLAAANVEPDCEGYLGAFTFGSLGNLVQRAFDETLGPAPGGIVVGVDGKSYEYDVTSTPTEFGIELTINTHSLVDGAIVGTQSFSAHKVLSGEYTSDDVIADCEGLLSIWSLSDNAVYPWRHDEYVTVAPLVTILEAPPATPDIGWQAEDYADSNAILCTGNVVGGPNEAGCEAHFNTAHENWRCCINPDPGPDAPAEDPYVRSEGAFTPAFLPQTATQWTDYFHASFMWPGAWMSCGELFGASVFMQKWTEVGIKRPALKLDGTCDYTESAGAYTLLEYEFDFRDVAERDRVIAQAREYLDGGLCVDPDFFEVCEDVQPADPTPIRPVTRELKAVTATDYTITPSTDAETVLCISPNGEAWVNGTTHDFGAFAMDERYGARWQGAIRQHMTDPCWEAPPMPEDYDEEEDGPWIEDVDGDCDPDSKYAHRPVVESVTSYGGGSLPGSPPLNVLTVEELNDAETDGIEIPPPPAVGLTCDDAQDPITNTVETPWGLYLRESACVNASGTWATEYDADGVHTSDYNPP